MRSDSVRQPAAVQASASAGDRDEASPYDGEFGSLERSFLFQSTKCIVPYEQRWKYTRRLRKKPFFEGSDSTELSWTFKGGFHSSTERAQGSRNPSPGLCTFPSHGCSSGGAGSHHAPHKLPGSGSAGSVTQQDPPLSARSHPAGLRGALVLFFFPFHSASLSLKALLQSPTRTPGDLNLTPLYCCDAFEAGAII